MSEDGGEWHCMLFLASILQIARFEQAWCGTAPLQSSLESQIQYPFPGRGSSNETCVGLVYHCRAFKLALDLISPQTSLLSPTPPSQIRFSDYAQSKLPQSSHQLTRIHSDSMGVKQAHTKPVTNTS